MKIQTVHYPSYVYARFTRIDHHGQKQSEHPGIARGARFVFELATLMLAVTLSLFFEFFA